MVCRMCEILEQFQTLYKQVFRMQYIQITSFAAAILVLGHLVERLFPDICKRLQLPSILRLVGLVGLSVGRSFRLQKKIYLDETHGFKHLYETCLL